VERVPALSYAVALAIRVTFDAEESDESNPLTSAAGVAKRQ
jgi:hypothetical protein